MADEQYKDIKWQRRCFIIGFSVWMLFYALMVVGPLFGGGDAALYFLVFDIILWMLTPLFLGIYGYIKTKSPIIPIVLDIPINILVAFVLNAATASRYSVWYVLGIAAVYTVPCVVITMITWVIAAIVRAARKKESQ